MFTLSDHVDLTFDISEIDWIVGDTHFSHKNIIKYCRSNDFDYSWDGVENMNWAIMAQWNKTVDLDDTVLFLGDLVWLRNFNKSSNQLKVDDLYSILNGEIIPLKGDHDHVKPSSEDEWNYSALIRGENRRYLACHFPERPSRSLEGGELPEDFEEEVGELLDRWSGWTIHGHHHNNHPDKYPSVAHSGKNINCSIEMNRTKKYAPIAMERIKEVIDRSFV